MRLLLRFDFYLAQFELSFDKCFYRPDMRPLFYEHLKKFFNEEPLEFIEAVEAFKRSNGSERRRHMEDIFKVYIRGDGTKQINIPHSISKNLFAAYQTWTESDTSIFDAAAVSITYSIKTNFFTSFTISMLFRKWLYEKLKLDEEMIYEIATPVKDTIFPISQFAIADDEQLDDAEKQTTAAVYISTNLPPHEEAAKDFTYSFFRRICSIRVFIPLTFILQIIFVFLFVFLTTFLPSETAIMDISKSQQLGILQRINDTAHNVLVLPTIILNLADIELKAGLYNITLDGVDYNSLSNETWRLVNAFPQVTGVYYGNEYAFFIEHERLVNGSYSVWQKFPTDITRVFRVDDRTGEIIPGWAPTNISPTYNPSKRPWYLKVKQTNRLAWQDVYVYAAGDLGITAGAPVYGYNSTTKRNEFAGVMAVDMTIDKLNTFLASLDVSNHGRCFMTGLQGLLVAVSAGRVSNAKEGTQILATESNDLLIAATARALTARFGSFDKIMRRGVSIEYFRFQNEGQEIYVQIARFVLLDDISWLIIVAVPQQDILGPVLRNNIAIYTIMPVGLLVSIVVSIFMTICITRPLRRLRKEMMQVSKMTLDTHSESTSTISEIRHIQSSFYAMIYSLRSFKKYVPSTVLSRAVETQNSAKRFTSNGQVAIVALDITNFHHLAQLLAPGELRTLMSEFMTELSTIVHTYNGSIDTYVSNAIVIIFSKTSNEQYHQNACDMAESFKYYLKKKEEIWKENGMPVLRCFMAIHSGQCLIGNFGHSPAITAMGKVVNTCVKMLGECSTYGVSMIISENCYAKVKKQMIGRYVDVLNESDKKRSSYMFELIGYRDDSTTSQLAIELICNDMLLEQKTKNMYMVRHVAIQAMKVDGYEKDTALQYVVDNYKGLGNSSPRFGDQALDVTDDYQSL